MKWRTKAGRVKTKSRVTPRPVTNLRADPSRTGPLADALAREAGRAVAVAFNRFDPNQPREPKGGKGGGRWTKGGWRRAVLRGVDSNGIRVISEYAPIDFQGVSKDRWPEVAARRALPPISRPEKLLDEARAKVRTAADLASALFGRTDVADRMNPEGIPDVARAVGARRGSVVNVTYETWKSPRIRVHVQHPDYTSYRYARLEKRPGGGDRDYDKVMENYSLFVAPHKTKSGLGLSIFRDQVNSLRAMGFARIETWAARGPDMNGYYTWPRFGYDQPISKFRDRRTRERILKAFPDAKSVLDIMETEEGRKWWKKNGANMRSAVFDLTPGSRSLRVWEAYQAERSARGNRPTGNLLAGDGPGYAPSDDNVDDLPPDDGRGDEIGDADELLDAPDYEPDNLPLNVFCPTGKGGGVDPTCSPGGKPKPGTVLGVENDADRSWSDNGTFRSELRAGRVPDGTHVVEPFVYDVKDGKAEVRRDVDAVWVTGGYELRQRPPVPDEVLDRVYVHGTSHPIKSPEELRPGTGYGNFGANEYDAIYLGQQGMSGTGTGPNEFDSSWGPNLIKAKLKPDTKLALSEQEVREAWKRHPELGKQQALEAEGYHGVAKLDVRGDVWELALFSNRLVSVPDDPAANFDPNQPRDADGKWSRFKGTVAEKIPPGLRRTAALAARAYFATFIMGRQAALAVAREKGLDEAQLEKLGKVLTSLDVATGGSRAAALAAAVGAGGLAIPAGLVPWFSVGYLAYSMLTAPGATGRAAGKGLGRLGGSMGRGLGHLFGRTADEFLQRRWPGLLDDPEGFSTNSGPDPGDDPLESALDASLASVDWVRHLNSAYLLGLRRGHADAISPRVSSGRLSPAQAKLLTTEFVANASRLPPDRVRNLVYASLRRLGGLTSKSAAAVRRAVTEGVASNLPPRKLAARVAKVAGMTAARARTIARTETVRAHAEGQLDAMAALGVNRLRVKVEFETTPDGRRCRKCSRLDGRVFTMNQARGLIPAHPNCRCAWIPALDKPASPNPRRYVGNVFCPTGKGGGIDPTCSPGGRPGPNTNGPPPPNAVS